jgi:putative acetyltransferase
MIEIIDFEDKYENDFRQLNLEWLYKYKLAESHDLEVLNDPRGTIIDKGGCIFLAKEQDIIAGSAALMKAGDHEYELAKMTVANSFRGLGISKLLLTRCLDEAKKLQAKKIILFSNHQLEAALHLYKQYGFKHIPVEDSPFETADVKMELVL